MIKSNLEKLSECKRKLNIVISKETANKDYQSTVRKYRSYAILPGFRKGKAPISMIESIYKQQIKAGYLEEYIPKYYRQALLELEKEKIFPINQGALENFDWSPGEDLKIDFKFEVKPDVELKKYRDFEIPFKPEKVTKMMIENELKRLQQTYAKIIDKESSAEVNDLIYYQVEKYDDKKVSKQEEISYRLGTKNFGEKFDKDLTGAKLGDVIDTTIELSPTSSFVPKTPDLSGVGLRRTGKPEEKLTEIKVSLKINSIKKIELPALDDEFAKDVGDYKSLKDLKAEIKKGFDEQVKIRNENKKSSLILQRIIEVNPFELPESIVNDYVSKMVNQSENRNHPQAGGQENIKKMEKVYRKYAENEFRVYYVLEKLRELEKVEVNDDEIENEIKKAANSMNMDIEQYKKLYKKQINKDAIKMNLINEKILKNIENTVRFV
ncbi:MAG: trigger factor [Candidatus Cloacimonadota bacterium]|nr:trigger factor [Candidatus Cloacimonadota bacterium]